MVTLQRICLLICMSCTKLIPRKPIPAARIKSSGFEDIGLKNGSNTASSLKNMQRKMPSRDLGVISSIEAFNPRAELKPLNKASIHAWFVGHSQRTQIPPHYYGVVTTLSSSATTSLLWLRQEEQEVLGLVLQPRSLCSPC